jgi:ABC-type transporter Mla MlaB component
MLRITRIDTPTQQKLILEGRLTLPWIADLSSHWEVTRHEDPERKFVVDLRGVTRIDNAGESALALMKDQGAEFLASSLRIKDFLKDLAKIRGYCDSIRFGGPAISLRFRARAVSCRRISTPRHSGIDFGGWIIRISRVTRALLPTASYLPFTPGEM